MKKKSIVGGWIQLPIIIYNSVFNRVFKSSGKWAILQVICNITLSNIACVSAFYAYSEDTQ